MSDLLHFSSINPCDSYNIRDYRIKCNKALVDFIYENADSINEEKNGQNRILNQQEIDSFNNFMTRRNNALSTLIIEAKSITLDDLKKSERAKYEARKKIKEIEHELYMDVLEGEKLIKKIASGVNVDPRVIANYCDKASKFVSKNGKRIAVDAIVINDISNIEESKRKLAKKVDKLSDIKYKSLSIEQRTQMQQINNAISTRIEDAIKLINIL